MHCQNFRRTAKNFKSTAQTIAGTKKSGNFGCCVNNHFFALSFILNDLGLKALKGDKQINLKKADKCTNTVVMTKEDKLNEGQIQLNVKEHYRPLK